MISMGKMGEIRRMCFRDKLSLHQMGKRTGLSRNTIRKWIRAPETKQSVYQRQAPFNKLSPFHETLEQALKAVRIFSTVDLINLLEREKYDGKTGRITQGLLRTDLVVCAPIH